MRVSGTDWAEGGWDLDQTIAFAKALAARGCSAIHVSSGGMTPAQKWFRRWTTEIAVTDRRVNQGPHLLGAVQHGPHPISRQPNALGFLARALFGFLLLAEF